MNCVLLASLLWFMPAQNVYAPSDFIDVNGASLMQRYDDAVAQGRRNSDDTFWVAYEMTSAPTRRSNSNDGIEVVQVSTSQRIGMFLLVGKSDGAIQKLHIVDLAQELRVHDRRVYWLGKPASDDSAALLLTIARAAASAGVKKDAIFWLAQEISGSVGTELEKLADSDPETEIQKQAVFALSLRNSDDSVPRLIRIAKDHPKAAVRSQAIFWLGQKRDPRVLDFFQEMLKK